MGKERKSKVLLIWPFGAFDGATMPLAFLYLLPILKQHGYEVDFLDCALHDISPDSPEFADHVERCQPDVVGVSAWSVHKEMATKTLQAVKNFDSQIMTIAGGPHFSGDASYSLHSDRGIIDFVFKGEAEESLLQFLDHVSQPSWTFKELKDVPGLCFIQEDGSLHESPAKPPSALDALGQPDYSIIGLPEYIQKGYCYRSEVRMQAPLLTTRGCPYTCDFCSAPFLNGRRVRKHSIPYLLELLKTLYAEFGIRHFNIIDDNFTFDVPYAKQFCKMVIENGHWLKDVSFGTPNGIRIEKTDEDLFYLMKGAGWRRVIVAPESGSQTMVDFMAKHLKLQLVPEKTRQIQQAGLECEAFFIIGHPGENAQTIQETKQFIKDVKFDVVSIHVFQPLQGTPIYNELLAMGTLGKGDTIRSYDEIHWVPEGWTRQALYEVVQDLMRISVKIFPFRWEWVFSKFCRSGQILSRLCGDDVRQWCFRGAQRIRRWFSEQWFDLAYGSSVRDKIGIAMKNMNDSRMDRHVMDAQTTSMMRHSDELKQKASLKLVTLGKS